MQLHQVDSSDDAAFDAWYEILWITDQERWPGDPGWTRRTVKAMAEKRDGSTSFICLSAIDESGKTVGIGMLDVPNLENLHQVSVDVRVPPDQRRRGIGSAIVVEMERWAAAHDRAVIHSLVEVRTFATERDASAPFARHHGFEVVQRAHTRILTLPVEPELLGRLKAEVAEAAAGYRMHAFTTPWPDEYLNDFCELARRMSTDAPSGDDAHEEEVWDAERVKEMDDLVRAQGLVKFAAAAEHIASGRLVAFTEIALPDDPPTEGWQWATLVMREHRGHRLGLAVKLANLDYVSATYPTVRRIITGNAQENAPMIAVNEAMGFVVEANQTMWQKRLEHP
jgi:GNAT superfamily N-acetyltransferase